MSNVYQFSATDNKNNELSLSDFSDKVLLIVNTASGCGLTPQYEGLQKLHTELSQQGFEILAFPCNQFKQQESGTNEEIQQFCDLNFNIKFPLFDKIEVNGDNTHPLFTYLKQQAPGILGSKSIKWNFTKFLVNRRGEVIKRYAPTTKPEALIADIKNLLAQ
jgi:glutathione peroxidase